MVRVFQDYDNVKKYKLQKQGQWYLHNDFLTF
jgi:hypothetical protein